MLKFNVVVVLSSIIVLTACDSPSSDTSDTADVYSGPDASAAVSEAVSESASLSIDPVTVSQSLSELVLSWPPVANADTYLVSLSTDAGFYDSVVTGTNALTITGIEPVSYSVVVTARNMSEQDIASSAIIATSAPRAIASTRTDTAP